MAFSRRPATVLGRQQGLQGPDLSGTHAEIRCPVPGLCARCVPPRDVPVGMQSLSCAGVGVDGGIA